MVVTAGTLELGAVVFAVVIPEEVVGGPPNILGVAVGAVAAEVLGKLENNEGVLVGMEALEDAAPKPENKPAPPVPGAVAFDCPLFVPADGNVEELVVGAEGLLMPVKRLGAVPGVAVEEGVFEGFPGPVPNKEVGLGVAEVGA